MVISQFQYILLKGGYIIRKSIIVIYFIKMIESEMDNRESKSDMLSVKEQRVDGCRI